MRIPPISVGCGDPARTEEAAHDEDVHRGKRPPAPAQVACGVDKGRYL